MALRKPLDISYVNDLDQEIKPGDEVLVITTGRSHSVSVGAGIFLGMTAEGDSGSCIVLLKEYKNVFRHKETGEEFVYAKHGSKLPYPQYPRFHDVTWNSRAHAYTQLSPQQVKENEEAKAKYQSERKAYDEDIKRTEEPFHYVSEPYDRRTTLRRNRVYSINMSLKDFIRKI
jgi:hypothetical protein